MKKNKSTPVKIWAILGALLPALLLWSCAVREPPIIMKMADLPLGGDICRIAVLPFTNQTDYRMADTIYTRVFTSELIGKSNYIVSQEGDVRNILNQLRMLPGEVLSSEQLRALADRLGVQVVITGAVLEMRDKIRYGQRLDPSLAVVVRILEASSGRTIWTTYNRSEGNQYRIVMHFGLINSINALAQRSAAEIFEAWEKKGFKECPE
jgi:TolB-like protein